MTAELPASPRRAASVSRSRAGRQRRFARSWIVAGVAVAALATGCAGGAASDSAQQLATSGPLKALCPQRVVIQAAWYPTADIGLPFQLMGGDWTIDAKLKRVSGSLMDGRTDTGIDVEFRSGGEATGFQSGPAVAYAHPDQITLAITNIDEIIGLSATQPMTAVMAPLNGDPQVLIWDPATHPEFSGINDIGETDTKVLYSSNVTALIGYLTGSGILRASQLSATYDGTPSQFVAARGRDVVQGYATNEPYVYETLPAWHKPVRYALTQDTGYPNYADVLAVRTGDLPRLTGCLGRLVPILQRGLIAYMTDPRPALDRMVKAVAAFRVGFVYDQGAAEYGICQLQHLGLVSNPISRVAGGYDTTKLERMIDILKPVLTAQRKPPRSGLAVADVATSQFLDPHLSLPTQPRLGGLKCKRSTP